jgi:Txe/YoeB family toxin of Txe-Axe toxin-antitoxin module
MGPKEKQKIEIEKLHRDPLKRGRKKEKCEGKVLANSCRRVEL